MTYQRPFFVLILLIVLLIGNVIPCGPGWIEPLFTTKSAPESPYESFAAGRLGLIKPAMHRSVLYAAYRYINGGGLSADEQKEIVAVWKADFQNRDFGDNDVDSAVTAWVAARAGIVGKEEKTPQIYTEREYGGYDFFPNCTKNAFETATETLKSRSAAHGSDSRELKAWVAAQDDVFQNCSQGRRIPPAPDSSMAVWLQKDRAYQIAAAQFYSLDFKSAKRSFEEISNDSDSPWQETAHYLVARTLIRQGSLAKDPESVRPLYEEAEQRLQRFASGGGKFSDSAQRMIGLIRYRIHPKERVNELGRTLAVSGGSNFRQDLIDYTWLMDKFELQALEEFRIKRLKAEGKYQEPEPENPQVARDGVKTVGVRLNDEDLELTVYSDDYARSWRFYLPPDATDEDAVNEAQKLIEIPLSDDMKARIRSARQLAYSNRFDQGGHGGYEGGYSSEDKSLAALPSFIRQEPLTDWLFTYQIETPEAYDHALSRYRATGSELWLMTAISRASTTSPELAKILEAAGKVPATSPTFATVAYHAARIYLAQGKHAEARRFIDDVIGRADTQPISTINQFLEMRTKLAQTLDEYLSSSLRKPFAFDFDGSIGSIEEFIADEKSYYNPKYANRSKEDFEKEVDERYAERLMWQSNLMFDEPTIDVMNKLFPNNVLMQVESSKVMPSYLRERFALAIWVRAALLNDEATRRKVTPEAAKVRPEFAAGMAEIDAAKTPEARDTAILWFLVQNPILSPYLESGLPRTDNSYDEWSADDWWCAPYDASYDEESGKEIAKKLPPRPRFLSAAEATAAQTERAKLAQVGNAPQYLAKRVLAWAKRSPADKRLPEALYIVYIATGWNKYGCGGEEELRGEAENLLRAKFPSSEWTRKLDEKERDDQ